MSPAAVILIAVLACITGLAAWVVIAERLDPPQRGNPPAVPAGRQHTARPGPDLDALTPGPGRTGWLEPLPDDDPADITGVQPPSTRYLGKEIGQYLDELFDKHAEAQQ
jgi:hypothetical protein